MKNRKQMLGEYGVDALLVSRYHDILYLTGFKTLSPTEREAYVLLTPTNTYVFSDGRYRPQTADGRFTFLLLTPDKGLISFLREILAREGISSLGFQQEDLKWTEYNALSKTLGIPLAPVDRAILLARGTKSEGEIGKVREACRAADRCLKEMIPFLVPGATEKEIAWKMESWIRQHGWELAFDPMVAVDANAALPHYDTKAGRGKIRQGSVILIDFGVSAGGYCSDITRMFFVGEPSREITGSYNKLRKAQEETVARVRSGMAGREIDALCRTLLESSYPHSTGHGIGLEVHEYPKISSTAAETLVPGQVFTIEPGIYVPGKWGMRIEDTVVMTRGGKAERLTRFPKAMRVV